MSNAGINTLPPSASIRSTVGIDIVDADVAEPDRPGAVLLHLVGQRQDAAGDAAVAPLDHPVVAERPARRSADRPADDGVVEAPSRRPGRWSSARTR